MDLFPLECTPFEEYMLSDDRPDYPTTAFMELDLEGVIEPLRLQSALPAALARHPLLSAAIVQRRFGRPRWVPAACKPVLDVDHLEAPLCGVPTECINLAEGPGTRAWLRTTGDRGRLTIQVHHACSDAIGKLTFLTDWLSIAAARSNDLGLRSLPDPDLAGLRGRGRLPPRLPQRELPASAQCGGTFQRIVDFVGRRAVPLAGTPPERGAADTPLPGFHAVELAEGDYATLRAAARRAGLTFNDWLLTAMFVTLSAWTRRHADVPAADLLRVLVPYNIRSPDDLFESAANRIGFRCLSQPVSAADDWTTLSRDLASCMERIRCERSSDFMRMIHRLAALRLLGPVVRRLRGCSATVALSNLGDLTKLYAPRVPIEDGMWQFGDLRVTAIRAAPPKRAGTHLCLVLFGYGDRLHLVSRCDGRGIAADQTREFVGEYIATLRRLSGESIPARGQLV